MRYPDLAALLICIGLLLSAGCITMTKTVIRDMTTTPAPTEIPTPNITIKPTPTISQPVVYFPKEELRDPTERKVGEYWGWVRHNVSGEKDMKVKVGIYKYRLLESYQWWNVYMARYYTQMPAPGKKYLLIFPYMELIGDDPSEDPRYFVDTDPWSRFFIDYKQTLIAADTDYQRQNRIKELEETFTLNDDDRVKPWGYIWLDGGIGKGIYAESPEWLRMGRSNAWDGYILYQVPKDAQPKDLKVVSNWGKFGSVYWVLT